MMLRSAKIWSVHPLSLLKPACSSLSFSSIAFEILLMMIFARILLGTDSSVIPRQLLQSFRAPFLGILIIIPFVQSSGITSSSHIVVNRGCSMSADSVKSKLYVWLRRSLSELGPYKGSHKVVHPKDSASS